MRFLCDVVELGLLTVLLLCGLVLGLAAVEGHKTKPCDGCCGHVVAITFTDKTAANKCSCCHSDLKAPIKASPTCRCGKDCTCCPKCGEDCKPCPKKCAKGCPGCHK